MILARMAAGGQARRIGRRGEATVPLIDDDHLESLSRHIGHPATRELLADGRIELADRLERLARSAPGAGGDLGMLAHQIAGLAGSLGLLLLARRASRTAAAVRAGRDLAEPLAALLDAAEPSLDALHGWGEPERQSGDAMPDGLEDSAGSRV